MCELLCVLLLLLCVSDDDITHLFNAMNGHYLRLEREKQEMEETDRKVKKGLFAQYGEKEVRLSEGEQKKRGKGGEPMVIAYSTEQGKVRVFGGGGRGGRVYIHINML